MGEFLSMSIPERGYLLSPVLPVQGIGILYAPRGIGKTFAALSTLLAVASGGAVFNWRAPMPSERCMWMGKCPPLPCRTAFPLLSTACPFPRIR
ncbi:MAG: AAA family ATPase [Bilophila wadsworthia]